MSLNIHADLLYSLTNAQGSLVPIYRKKLNNLHFKIFKTIIRKRNCECVRVLWCLLITFKLSYNIEVQQNHLVSFRSLHWAISLSFSILPGSPNTSCNLEGTRSHFSAAFPIILPLLVLSTLVGEWAFRGLPMPVILPPVSRTRILCLSTSTRSSSRPRLSCPLLDKA